MTTPCVALLQFIFLRKTVSVTTIAALAAVCIGVGLTNTGDGAAGITVVGGSIAISAFVVTAFYQVWIGKKMKDFAVSSPQLLLNQAPISVFLLVFMVPFFDTLPNVSSIPRDTSIALVLSGLAAALLVSLLIFIGLEMC
jgi:solute carrier family 35 protein E3